MSAPVPQPRRRRGPAALLGNPTATILSAAIMLDWLGHEQTVRGTKMIEAAVQHVFDNPANRTPDMGGKLKTGELTDKIITAL